MKTTSIFISVFSFLLLTACSNDDETAPEIDPVVFNDIIGTVELYDDNRSTIDNSGMTVAVEGSSPLITATTDANGDYLLENVPFGTYTLTYGKEGFGTYKMFGIAHEDIGDFTLIPNELRLGQISNSPITEATAVIDGNFIVLTVTHTASDDLLVKRMRIFYHNSDDVSDANYTEISFIAERSGNPAGVAISIAFFNTMGFESGETIWFRVYGDNFYSNSYEDPDLGRTVFPNINPNTADAVSVVLP